MLRVSNPEVKGKNIQTFYDTFFKILNAQASAIDVLSKSKTTEQMERFRSVWLFDAFVLFFYL
jgi:hypothetical protein